MDGRTYRWGRKVRGRIIRQTPDSTGERLTVVYVDENDVERTVYAEYNSDWAAKQAMLDDLMRRANEMRKPTKYERWERERR